MAIHIFVDGVKFSFQNDPFETWLDQRMTYKQPQRDWDMHQRQQRKGITGNSQQRLCH